MDLRRADTAQAARELGVPDERFTTIASQIDGITPANGANASPGAIEEIAGLVAAGQLGVAIAASFPVEQIRAAVELQAGGTCTGGSSSTSRKSGKQDALLFGGSSCVPRGPVSGQTR
ncbi:MAG TPA: hypothetical protein VHW64_14615, partial [Nocardioides sp.]|nr:hypothetical protein [Nocardioides sp.]